MSIYIKGMEMPTNCSECAFCGYYGNGEHMCDIIQKAVEYESAKMSRLDDCPLVPVPDHGRILKVLKTERECVSRDCDRKCGECDLALERNEILGAYDAIISMLSDPADKE